MTEDMKAHSIFGMTPSEFCADIVQKAMLWAGFIILSGWLYLVYATFISGQIWMFAILMIVGIGGLLMYAVRDIA